MKKLINVLLNFEDLAKGNLKKLQEHYSLAINENRNGHQVLLVRKGDKRYIVEKDMTEFSAFDLAERISNYYNLEFM
jgi:hypothetical protein